MGLSIPGNMQAKCIDYGQNFLTGQATSILSASGIDIQAGNVKELADAIQDKTMAMVGELQSTATKQVTQIGSEIGNAAGSVAGAGLAAMQGAFQSADLVKLAIGEVTSYSAALLGDLTKYAVSKAAAFPGDVTKKATAKAAEDAKEKLSSALKQVMGSPAEEQSKKEAKEQKENKVKKAIKWVKNAASDAEKFKTKILSYISEDAQDISALMIQGPEWVNNQVESAVNNTENFVYTYFQKAKENIDKQYDNMVNSSYLTLASTMTKEIIDPTIDKAKKLYDNNTKSTNKQVQKAKTAVQKQLFKLAGKLGISPNG